MKILIACEESQIVTKAFRESGFLAFSNDIIDCSGAKLMKASHKLWRTNGENSLWNANVAFVHNGWPYGGVPDLKNTTINKQ
jgi:hypothetical protein